MENQQMGNQPMMQQPPAMKPTSPKKFPTSVAVIIAVVLTAVIVGGGVYWWQNMLLNEAEENLTNVQNSLQQQINNLTTELATEQQTAAPVSVEDQIEKWSLYKENTGVQVGSGKCSNQEFNSFLDQANAGSRKTLNLNGVILVVTPNYNNWTNEKFVGFGNDNTAFCNVGGFSPLRAYSDKLLWIGGCGTGGAAPEPEEPDYAAKVAALNLCNDTIGEINNYFQTAVPTGKIEEYLLFQDDAYHFRITGTAKSCEDFYNAKVIESLENSIKSYGIFAPGSKSWPKEYPAFTYALYSQATYDKFSPTELPGKPQIVLRLDYGELLTWWQPQDSPPDMPRDCRINFEKF